MSTLCRAYGTEGEAREAVSRLLDAGSSDAEIRVITAEPARDLRDAPVGRFAGNADPGRVGSFANAPGSSHDTMGQFAGPDDQRRGGFGDLDRETVTTYADGIRRVQIASHRKLKRMLVDAGLDDATAASDVEALHQGRVLVLVRLTTLGVDQAAAVLDAPAAA